jgi:hypothetical protein
VCSHLIKRSNRYSIRRKNPVDLQSHYGRVEVVKALGTSDRREAEQLCRIAGAKLDEEFANVRAALAASATTQDTPATVPDIDAPNRVNADEVASRKGHRIFVRIYIAGHRPLLRLVYPK